MTMQTSNPKHGGFLHSAAGQMTATIVIMIVVILLAWRYVF
jgi:hypothetical protein